MHSGAAAFAAPSIATTGATTLAAALASAALATTGTSTFPATSSTAISDPATYHVPGGVQLLHHA